MKPVNTKILKVSKNADTAADIENLKYAADVIKRGGLVAFPTETVYGLGASALDGRAVEAIFEAKGRPQNNPLIIHLCDKSDIGKYCDISGVKDLEKLTALMPAPLTVIVPKKDVIAPQVTAGNEGVAFRIPESVIARKLIEFSGVPIAAPSANLSGKPSPTCAGHVIEDMTGRADVIIDGGDCEVGVESTIITLCTEPPTLLRPGGVTYETLLGLLGDVDISHAVLESLKEGEKVLSPGMMYKHYSPNTPVTLVKGERENIIDFINAKCITENCAVICYNEDAEKINGKNVLCAGTRLDNTVYASRLFSLLRDADALGTSRIYAVLPEDTSGISLAIYNRMLRAAGFDVREA